MPFPQRRARARCRADRRAAPRAPSSPSTCPDSRSSVTNVASFSCARFFVSGVIQASASMRSPSAVTQVRDERLHLRLGLRREVLLRRTPAPTCSPSAPFTCVHGALPALALLRLAAHRRAVEREARLVEALRQVRRVIVEVVEGEVVLQRRRAASAPTSFAMSRIAVSSPTMSSLREPSSAASRNACQSKPGAYADELRLRARVVDRVHVAPLLDRPAARCAIAVSNAMMPRAFALRVRRCSASVKHLRDVRRRTSRGSLSAPDRP